MGNSRWSPSDWMSYSSTAKHKTRDDIFTVRSHDKAKLAVKGVKIRESRDSALNPESNAIIIGLDETGSMGELAEIMAKEGLGTLIEEILTRKPVSDPHIMIMGIGDAYCDRCPIQATQFEADMKLVDQLENLYLEGNGGGNNFESYNFPWYFAALHTSIDCFEKRGKKGYLFTIGDEETPDPLLASQIKEFIGDKVQQDFDNDQLLTMAGRMYNIFHIIVEQGAHASAYPDKVRKSWSKLLGQRAISLSDHTKLAEVIVSAIEVNEGRDRDKVAASWDGKTNLVVAHALKNLPAGTSGSGKGVTRL